MATAANYRYGPCGRAREIERETERNREKGRERVNAI